MSATTSPPKPNNARQVQLHNVDSVTMSTRLGVDATSSRDKELEARCLRHEDRHTADPNNHDVLYAWGLTLQEMAERAEVRESGGGGQSPTSSSTRSSKKESEKRVAHLREACEKYAQAVRLKSNFPAALYNHGIALGDLARAAGLKNTQEAYALWSEACVMYSLAVKAAIGDDCLVVPGKGDAGNGTAVSDDTKSPTTRIATYDTHVSSDTTRALNNWGLAAQQLAALASNSDDRISLLLTACGRFRDALTSDPTFHRSIYNLGTVQYALSELAIRRQRRYESSVSVEEKIGIEKSFLSATRNDDVFASALGETSSNDANELKTAAACYICIASASVSGTLKDADQSAADAYRNALRMVKNALPRPSLKCGWLRFDGDDGNVFYKTKFELNHHNFQAVNDVLDVDVLTDSQEGSGVDPWKTLDAVEPDTFFTKTCVAANSRGGASNSTLISIPLRQIQRVVASDDVYTSYSGFGFSIRTETRGYWFTVDTEAERDLWVDLIALVSSLVKRGGGENLGEELKNEK